MKKLIITVLLIVGMTVSAQKKEYSNISLAIDPSASIKEKSPNVVVELELVSYWKYVKASVQVLPDLKGGYIDLTGGFGGNVILDRFSRARVYSGVRLGFIKRGFTSDKTFTYPLAGVEGGINYNLSESFYVGVRGTGDYRSDFKYSGAEPSMRYSGFVKIGFNL